MVWVEVKETDEEEARKRLAGAGFEIELWEKHEEDKTVYLKIADVDNTKLKDIIMTLRDLLLYAEWLDEDWDDEVYEYHVQYFKVAPNIGVITELYKNAETGEVLIQSSEAVIWGETNLDYSIIFDVAEQKFKELYGHNPDGVSITVLEDGGYLTSEGVVA
jgi:hypothetical protein